MKVEKTGEIEQRVSWDRTDKEDVKRAHAQVSSLNDTGWAHGSQFVWSNYVRTFNALPLSFFQTESETTVVDLVSKILGSPLAWPRLREIMRNLGFRVCCVPVKDGKFLCRLDATLTKYDATSSVALEAIAASVRLWLEDGRPSIRDLRIAKPKPRVVVNIPKQEIAHEPGELAGNRRYVAGDFGPPYLPSAMTALVYDVVMNAFKQLQRNGT